LVQPDPPLPVLAEVYTAERIVVVTYDRPLQPNPALDPGNWSVRISPYRRTTIAAYCDATYVAVQYKTGGTLQVGPDVVDYSPPPYDLVSPAGAPAESFEDYPVVPA